MKGQELRPSQYLYSYGVGAIVEAPDGPRVIKSIDQWGNFFDSPNPLDVLREFEIHDWRAKSVLRDARFFRLPTNADLKYSSSYVLFSAKPFPRWGLCMKHWKLARIRSDGKTGCPDCDPSENGGPTAIRFVLACPDGHLADINWNRVIHGGKPCGNEVYEWNEEGHSLDEIQLICTEPSCHAETKLGAIYRTFLQCPGIMQESGEQENCDRDARVVLRQASYLRVPEVRAFLTIPPISTQLHLALSEPAVRAALHMLDRQDKLSTDIMREELISLAREQHMIREGVLREILRASDRALLEATRKVLKTGFRPETLIESEKQELDALRIAVEDGAPPALTASRPTLEIEKGSSETFPISEEISLRVTPVKRLRTISVQIGYRRLVARDEIDPRHVETAYVNNGKWYVALEMMGEGIFIDLPPDNPLVMPDSETVRAWRMSYASAPPEDAYKYHPEFVWLHTLSHRVITALGIDSGYSSASIRERVYFTPERQHMIGGILLYVSQRGMDGTLGGLIALVRKFDRILKGALHQIDSCSNDPLCRGRVHHLGAKTGAACYGCLLVSETSCEHRNLFLDRNLLMETLS